MGNVPPKSPGFYLFQRFNTELILESDSEYWSSLFLVVSQLPDFSKIITSQKSNFLQSCKYATEILESLWLQLNEMTPSLVVSAENALNFLSNFIPLTIEQNLFDFFWDQRLLSYRIMKSLVHLYQLPNFTSDKSHSTNSSNFLQDNHFPAEFTRRKSLILKVIVSSLNELKPAWKMMLTHDIVPCEEFIYALLNTLADTNTLKLQKLTAFILESVTRPQNGLEFLEPDMIFIRNMMKERQNYQYNNCVRVLFQNLSDESINRVLTCVSTGIKSLENTDDIHVCIKFLSHLFALHSSYVKYTAISQHFLIVTCILNSKKFINLRTTGVSLVKVFYFLSKYREFCISLSVVESNSLIQTVCKVILFPNYEFSDYFPLLFGTLCNVSAFLIEIDKQSSQDMVKAYEYIANKEWILEKESNHYNVFYIVQAFTNILQYQWEGASYLVYTIVKKRESFYKIIRMQMNDPEERNLDDEATDGEIVEESQIYEENDNLNSENPQEEDDAENEEAKLSERLSEEDPSMQSARDEYEDQVVDLERIHEGFIIGLDAGAPDEVVQRTSYLNTHVSTFSEELERRNTVQHVETKEAEWKPTPAWMLVWKTKLPMKTIFVTIKELFSTVIEMQEAQKDLEEIAQAIRETTLVGLLPKPHPIYLVLNLL